MGFWDPFQMAYKRGGDPSYLVFGMILQVVVLWGDVFLVIPTYNCISFCSDDAAWQRVSNFIFTKQNLEKGNKWGVQPPTWW